jgi:hypothetical protein
MSENKYCSNSASHTGEMSITADTDLLLTVNQQ